jgi:ABC-type polysaccharide/polyol phosphate export permease
MLRIPGAYFFRNVIAGRSLLYQLVRRDFQQRFVGSAVGWIWGLIHPLVLLASWIFVFQVCLKQELPPGEITQNYSLFLFCGFIPWLLFQETVSRSANSLLEHANLITKTVFPSEIIPVSIFLSALLNHLLALGIVLVATGIWSGGVSMMVIFLPVYMLCTGLLAVGIGWIASSLQVYLRDTAHVLTVLLTCWFWLTPIFISEELVPVRLRFIVKYNPLAYVVRAYRERILSHRLPDWSELVILAAFSVSAFVVGGLIFRHLKRGFADVL